MNYPEHAIEKLKEISVRLDKEFMGVWSVLSPSVERDEVMYHLITAKKKINDIVEGNENG